jgi:quercetin dioxygenase-like cupin family protein
VENEEDGKMRTALISMALMLCASAQGAEPILVDQESHHTFVYSDSSLRVLEVKVPEGKETLDHLHRNDITTVCIDCAQTRTRVPGEPYGEIRPRKAGGFLIAEYAGKPAVHAVKNVGTGIYRLVGVENVRQSGWTTAAPMEDQPGTTLAQTSRAFHVYDVMAEPGKPALQHTHASPTVVVLDKGVVTHGIGKDSKPLAKPGEWILVPAGSSHTINPQGSGAAHLVEIEVR